MLRSNDHVICAYLVEHNQPLGRASGDCGQANHTINVILDLLDVRQKDCQGFALDDDDVRRRRLGHAATRDWVRGIGESDDDV